MGKIENFDLVGVESTGLVLPPNWAPAAFSEGLSRVHVIGFGKKGYIDRTGQWVIEPQFEDAQLFQNGLAAVQQDQNSKWGYIDKNGEVVIPARFDNVGPFFGELAVVMVDKYCGFINQQGEIVIPCQYRSASSFSEGLAAVECAPNKWGYINNHGRLVLAMPSSCRWVEGFSEGLARVCGGYINTQGKVVIDTNKLPGYIYDSFFEGLACFKDGSEWGFINKQGQVVIKPRFQKSTLFKEGLAPAKICRDNDEAGVYGYINPSGEMVIPPQFKYAGFFFDGLAWVEKVDSRSILIKHP